jgi:hypothetical protein
MSAWLSDIVLRHVFLPILLLPPDWSDPAYAPPIKDFIRYWTRTPLYGLDTKLFVVLRGRSYVLKDTLGEAIVTNGYRRDTNVVEIF